MVGEYLAAWHECDDVLWPSNHLGTLKDVKELQHEPTLK